MGWVLVAPLASAAVALFLFGSMLFGMPKLQRRSMIVQSLFLLHIASMIVWCIGIAYFISAAGTELATLSAKIYYIAGLCIMAFFYYFALFFYRSVQANKITKKDKTQIVGAALPVLLFSAVFYFDPDVLFYATTINPEGYNTVSLSLPGYSLYLFIFLFYTVMAFFRVFGFYQKSQNSRSKKGLLLTAFAVASGVFGGGFFNLVLPLFGQYSMIWIGPLFVVPIVLVSFYSIAKYSLFDIRVATIRTAVYGATFGALIGLYFLIAFSASSILGVDIYGTAGSVPSVIASVILIILFQPIRLFFDRTIARIFSRKVKSLPDFFVEASMILTRSGNIASMMQTLARALQQQLGTENVSIHISWPDKTMQSASSAGVVRRPAKEDLVTLQSYAQSNKVHLASKIDDKQTIDLLTSYSTAAFFCGHISDDVYVLIMFGDKQQGFFTINDLKAVELIQGELKVALQNALSVHEVKKLNATLEQKIDAATKELRISNQQLQQLDEAKDEFVSMASHQLRTPLTSIKGYLSIVLDGDAGAVSETQKEFLGQAFASSERMVHLINDFLNVSRLQTGKFLVEKKSTDISKLAEQEVDGLQSIAAAHGLSIIFTPDKKILPLMIDEGKIRQVVMNFIDNAIYYSRQKSVIKVSVSHDEYNAFVKIRDRGIGVPLEEQDNLFGKFFRASNARTQRPDGTGVGLFLAKKVVTAHGGKIIFESTEGKGSTFGFSLPLAKASPRNKKN